MYIITSDWSMALIYNMDRGIGLRWFISVFDYRMLRIGIVLFDVIDDIEPLYKPSAGFDTLLVLRWSIVVLVILVIVYDTVSVAGVPLVGSAGIVPGWTRVRLSRFCPGVTGSVVLGTIVVDVAATVVEVVARVGVGVVLVIYMHGRHRTHFPQPTNATRGAVVVVVVVVVARLTTTWFVIRVTAVVVVIVIPVVVVCVGVAPSTRCPSLTWTGGQAIQPVHGEISGQ
ncbi:hypothetical protein EGW08_004188 [Elysia chlorotica]|uniref:Uncharacterized protein n=1 Tax=Elysia chlorotica TaxID=188477 RepID=A0A3S1HXB4_ELYCH|nr:hypothetical protein EGW08_004188 [Elysia chlorotica]